MGKLGWFMSRTQTLTSPPREGVPAGTYIRAEHKLYCNSKLNIISQVIIRPQVMFLEPIYMPRALNTGTCIQQCDLFILQANAGKKIGRGFGKNADEWT